MFSARDTHRPLARRSPARAIAAAVAVAAALAMLAGCTAHAGPSTHTHAAGTTPSSQARQVAAAPTTPAATPSSPPPTTTTPQATPVNVYRVACSSMISTAQLYAFNPNVSAQPGATPPAGSLVAQAVAAGGTACGWVYDSGNQSIQFALATPGPKALASLKEKAAADSTPTSAYGDGPNVAGFFHVTGSRGEVQVFTTGHWLVGLSSTFFEPGDAEQLVHDILANLHLG